MSFVIRRHADAGSFLARAGDWLLAREAEHNLLLGLARSMAYGSARFERPVYLATVERHNGIVGAAFRTPPHKFGLTRMPLEAVPALVADAAAVYPTLSTVLGSAAEATRFAELWGNLRGVGHRPGMAQRIYELDRVVPSTMRPGGGLRYARDTEAAHLADWGQAFHQDTGIAGGDPAVLMNDLIGQDRLFVWDDGGAKCMAAVMGDMPTGARIGYVYTPAEARGQGYASALVAALSQALLDGGRRFVCLYADQTAATPNRIYQQIGYRAVCDVLDVEFDRTR